MKYRLVTLVAFIIAVTATALTTHQLIFSYPSPTVRVPLKPVLSSYLGVYETGTPPSYRPVSQFANIAGRNPNLVGYYSGWAAPFNVSFADVMHRHGIIPFIQIDPKLASVAAITRGAYDSYLQSYADSVRSYGHAVVIGFGHEMNAPWYSWGYGHVPARTFVAAWRHIVSLFRDQGAQNVTWLWTINQDLPSTGHRIAAWWPGPSYVTWVGIDGYYFRTSDKFYDVFGRTIKQVRKLTKKPILLSETAVGVTSEPFVNIHDLFTGMQRYKTLGLVWFDKDQVGEGGITHQNWRIEGHVQSELEFNSMVRTTMTHP
jgi:mannan endo-1,4-beta-mannosidase